MRHRILSIVMALCISMAGTSLLADEQAAIQTTNIYGGLDPSKISPALRAYFECAETERQAKENDLAKKVRQDQAAISILGTPQDAPTPDEIQQLKDAADQAVAALPKAKASSLTRIKQSADYQQALTDLATAQKVLDDTGSSFDDRVKAANDRADARNRLHDLENSVTTANEVLQALQDEQRAAANYQKAEADAANRAQLESDQQALDSVRNSKGTFTPSSLESILGKTSSGSVGTLGDVQVKQVVDENNVLVSSGDTEFWLTNVSTVGLADDQTLTANIVEIVGTKTYTTVMGGNRTVRMLRLFDPAAEIQAAKAAQAGVRQPTAR